MRFWGDEYNNFKSRSLLFLVRVFRKGEWRVEYQEQMGDKVSAIGLAVSHVAEHIVLLPTLIDRIRLVSEISYDSFNWLAAGAFLAALL